MGTAGQYIYTVIVTVISVSALMALVPKTGAAASLTKLTAGIFIIIVVISPLIKIRIDDAYKLISNIKIDASDIVINAQKNAADEQMRVIKQYTESYISNKAAELGADIAVEIVLADEAPYAPNGINIFGSVSPFVKQKLTDIILRDLGIREDSQLWMLHQKKKD